MAFAIIRSVRAAAVTSLTTQDFTVAGIGTPKAAMVIITTATSLTGTSAAHRVLSIGVTDGTFQGGHGASDQDNVATTVAARTSFNNALIRFPLPGGVSEESIGTFNSFITDGIRINWTKASTVGYIVHVIFWAGTDVSVKCGNVIPNIVGGAAVNVNVGFEPQHIICLSGLDPLDETYRSDFHSQISHTINDGGTPITYSTYLTERNGFADGVPCLVRDVDLAQSIRASVLPFSYLASTEMDTGTPFDATGFNIVSGESAATGPRIVYFAINYGTKQYKLTVETASSGVASYTGYGFQPGYALVMAGMATTAWGENEGSDGATAGTFGFGHWSGAEQWFYNLLAESAAATTNTATRTIAKAISLRSHDDTSLVYEADFQGFTGDGFDLDWTTAFSHAQFVVFTLEEETITGDVAGTFPLATGSGTAQEQFVASGTPSFPKATGLGAAQEQFIASGSGSFPLATGAGVALLEFIAAGAGTFPVATGSGLAQLIFQATGAGTFPLATGAGVAELDFIATGSGTFPLVQATGVAQLVFIATDGAGNFALATGAGTAQTGLIAVGAGTFPLAVGAGTALLEFIASGAGLFPLPLGGGHISNATTQLGCESDLEGSRKVVSAIQGSYRLVGNMQGSYDLVTDFEGSEC